MCFIISFVPATLFITIGYFVLFSSTKADGMMKKFSQVLAIWIFVVSLVFPTCGAYVSLSGKCPIAKIDRIMQKVERRLMK